MDEREKIIDIIQSVKYCDTNNRCAECKYDKELENYKDMSCGSLKAADALIAAGIGDVTEWKERAEKHRVIALPGGRIKQLYSNEEVEQIAKERDELKERADSEIKSCYKEIAEKRDEIAKLRKQLKRAQNAAKKQKHRADVADRIAKKACDIVFSQEIDGEDWECAVSAYKELNDIGSEYGDDVITEDILYRYLQEQAQREIEKEKKQWKKQN